MGGRGGKWRQVGGGFNPPILSVASHLEYKPTESTETYRRTLIKQSYALFIVAESVRCK